MRAAGIVPRLEPRRIEQVVEVVRTGLKQMARQVAWIRALGLPTSPCRHARDLVDADLLAEVQVELARPDGYPRMLLASLPANDGHGHDLAAAVRDGRDVNAPLKTHEGSSHGWSAAGPHVDRTGSEPALVADQFLMNVPFGDVRVAAGQDWQLTSLPGPPNGDRWMCRAEEHT